MAPFIHPTAVVEPGVILGANSKVWHFCHVRAGAVLEDGVVLGKDVYIDTKVLVGRQTRIQNGVCVYQGVEVGPWCFVGPHVIFTNDLSPRAGNKNWQVVPTILKAGMSIGAGAIIRCGITLGEFSMVGAGAIVTKDVPPFHLVMGFTAKIEKMICACGQTTIPFGSPLTEAVRDCCKENLAPEALALAETVAGT